MFFGSGHEFSNIEFQNLGFKHHFQLLHCLKTDVWNPSFKTRCLKTRFLTRPDIWFNRFPKLVVLNTKKNHFKHEKGLFWVYFNRPDVNFIFEMLRYSSYILRRPQNFAKSSPYFWLQYIPSKVKFCVLLRIYEL